MTQNTMTPEQMEALTQWHDAKAKECGEQAVMYFDRETADFWLAESSGHEKSAADNK
jgi:hypothetical protein